MQKKISYKQKIYFIEIMWCGSAYCFRVIGISGFSSIPTAQLNDIEKIKSYIVKAIENADGNYDLSEIEKWDGKI